MPHVVRVKANVTLGRNVIGWRKSKHRDGTVHEKVVLRHCALVNDGMLEGDNPVSDTRNTENDFEIKNGVEERKLHRMAKVHDCLEMWQGSQNLHATQKESGAQNK